MIEVCPNLHVGSKQGEQRMGGQAGWLFIHACKEPVSVKVVSAGAS